MILILSSFEDVLILQRGHESYEKLGADRRMGREASAACGEFGALITRVALLLVLMVCGLTARARSEETTETPTAVYPAAHLLSSPTASWAGAYLGINAGGALPIHTSEHLQAIFTLRPPIYDLHPPSGLRAGESFGAQAGYNWQKGSFVYGLETDFNYLGGQSGRSAFFLAPSINQTHHDGEVYGYSLNYSPSSTFFGSLRGRIGFALGNTLIYGTGGVAVGGTRGPATLTPIGDKIYQSHDAKGSGSRRMKYILGGGLEHPLSDDTSLRFEYFYLNQALNGQFFVSNEANDKSVYWSKVRDDSHVFRVGLNHMFGDENTLPGTKKIKKENDAEIKEEIYSVHGVTTTATQGFSPFNAKYSGINSFSPSGQVRSGTIADVFMGIRLWEGGSAFVNPELNQGYGPQNTIGAANYVNGSTTRIGSGAPYMRYQRYFIRQVIGLGGTQEADRQDSAAASEQLEATIGQIAGKVDKNRLTLTVGKMSVQDIFDDNLYSHDPTKDFLNYAFITFGAFDYAQNRWGYTDGAAAEWRNDWWTARSGVYQLSQTPGGLNIEPVLLRQFMAVSELEGRYELAGQPGVMKFLFFSDNGYFSTFNNAINYAFAQNNYPPNTQNSSLWTRGQKNGAAVNIAQQISPGIGLFFRAGLNDGHYQTIGYTDANQSISGGVVLDGLLWERPDDKIGIAAAASGISSDFQRYLQLGGTGAFVGDGSPKVGNSLSYYLPGASGSPTGALRLSYAPETVMEGFYKRVITEWLEATIDYQLIINPGYNTARGPVNFFGFRLRSEF
jgi:high affinity Mn2+ porin